MTDKGIGKKTFQSKAIFTMTTFDYNYQNAFRFRF